MACFGEERKDRERGKIWEENQIPLKASVAT